MAELLGLLFDIVMHVWVLVRDACATVRGASRC